MSNKIELLAEDRSDKGKGASRRLRREGKVPAILYGGQREPRALVMDHDSLLHHLENEAVYSSILTVTVDDKSQPCVLKDLQRHPARPRILHVDLQRVLDDVEIRVRVPVHFLGEESAVGVKEEGGVISRHMTEVEVSCLPRYLPEYIEVDVSRLALDESITLSELSLPEGVEMVMPGDNVNLEVELIVPVALEQGSRFAIREGGLTVASGVITEILE